MSIQMEIAKFRFQFALGLYLWVKPVREAKNLFETGAPTILQCVPTNYQKLSLKSPRKHPCQSAILVKFQGGVMQLYENWYNHSFYLANMRKKLGVAICKSTLVRDCFQKLKRFQKICYIFSFFLNIDQTIHLVTSNIFSYQFRDRRFIQ